MRTSASVLATLTVVLAACGTGFAGPADLLKQAIEEEGQRPAATGKSDDVARLVSEGDAMVAQQRFNEAVSLYEKAYRLDSANQANYARLLVAKRSAGNLTAQDREALALLEEQQAADIDQVLRSVRLAMIQATQALRAGDADLAKARLKSGHDLLDRLPAFVDAKPYRTELKRLESVAGRKAVKQPRTGQKAKVDGSHLTLTEIDQEPVSQETTATTTTETGQIINVEGLTHDDNARHTYDRELTTALAHQRAHVILSNNEVALPPRTDGLGYPHDWAEKTARRAKYRDGVIYRGQTFTGEDGQQYYTAIYDLGDLVHPVPNFYATFPGFAADQQRELLDREALRQNSWIFNRGAEDLAAGLPLLHFFGGIDNNAVSTQADPREVDRIMATLERFINNK